jgi:hypothetical protein
LGQKDKTMSKIAKACNKFVFSKKHIPMVLQLTKGDSLYNRGKFELQFDSKFTEMGNVCLLPPKVMISSKGFPKELLDGGSGFKYFEKIEELPDTDPVQLEVVEEKEEKSLDTSGCAKVLLATILKTAKTVAEKEKERDEYEKMPNESRPSSAPESESETIKNASKDLTDGVNDFANCLKKGMTNQQAFRKIIENEAKSMVEDLVKEKLKSTARAKQWFDTVSSLQKKANTDLLSLRTVQQRILEEVHQELNRFNSDYMEEVKQIEEFRGDAKEVFAGASKAYAEMIKKTDGLARMLPSVVKAMEAWQQSPSEKTFKEVESALDAQLKEVEKAVLKEKNKEEAERKAETLRNQFSTFKISWLL